MQSSSLRRSTLNYIGVAILLVGLATAEFIYWQGLHSNRTNDEDILINPETARAYEHQVGMYMGTFGLIMDKGRRALETLGQPRPLAMTIGVVSLLLGGGCFFVASKLPPEEDFER